ncbi:hypothetical protein MSPP1_000409 [Malassezia sp. CBS 17886]|nr:hypothetical protein MSPP1_000409 [Malassezia sp. CBS 17886]
MTRHGANNPAPALPTYLRLPHHSVDVPQTHPMMWHACAVAFFLCLVSICGCCCCCCWWGARLVRTPTGEAFSQGPPGYAAVGAGAPYTAAALPAPVPAATAGPSRAGAESHAKYVFPGALDPPDGVPLPTASDVHSDALRAAEQQEGEATPVDEGPPPYDEATRGDEWGDC